MSLFEVTVELSRDQHSAVAAITSWHQSGSQTFSLAGLAGTGKTTILKYLDDRGLLGRNVLFAAYTGKAASVLQGKGIPATTSHKMLYYSKLVGVETHPKTGARKEIYEHTLKEEIEADCLVIDEASMLPADIKQDIESYGIPVLYVGDHGQLPPVNSKPAVDLDNADYKLETIHRQAENSPIIRAAMMARNGEYLKLQQDDDQLWVIPRKRLHDGFLQTAMDHQGVALCGYNRTRQHYNNHLKQMVAGSSHQAIEAGDRIICLKNVSGAGLYNGMTGICNSASFNKVTICSDGDNDILTGGIQLFDLAYCLTVHKSQGSEYRTVILLDESRHMDSPERWLYTGITRAKQNLLIVR